ncbi:MBL fold metallo-hydrolase [Saxibacter everestensis]|uniref:MBL fold metallo-hydrolase n=1 Tax=Saxibacter everestensis TaxID=2909229 RepID=A0ABY8QPQ0_9MICO|nr:MBL fold metallo-hydrolase [Brevibacteriaceae bacterium ZFBP1038]
MELTVIGATGSFPGPTSPASCYLLQDRDREGKTWNVVLDLGSGSLGTLQQHLELEDLDAVLLTHLHPDHCLDVCGLYVTRKFSPRRTDSDPAGSGSVRELAGQRLPIYGPPGTELRLGNAYYTDPGAALQPGETADPSKLGDVFTFTDWQNARERQIGPFTVRPILVEHPVEAYALRITGPSGEVLTYSGDTDDCPGIVEAARAADLFLCEAAFHEGRDAVRGIHLTGVRAGAVAAAAQVRRLVLTHIPPWNDPAVTEREATTAYSGPTELAEHGKTYSL